MIVNKIYFSQEMMTTTVIIDRHLLYQCEVGQQQRSMKAILLECSANMMVKMAWIFQTLQALLHLLLMKSYLKDRVKDTLDMAEMFAYQLISTIIKLKYKHFIAKLYYSYEHIAKKCVYYVLKFTKILLII